MATNEIFEDGVNLSVVCSHPAVPVSNDPVRFGEVVGVAQTDERADGTTSVTFKGVHLLSVKGIDGGGNSAVVGGDILYYVDADTPVLSKKNTGRRAGYALATSAGVTSGTLVAAGATASIRVKLGY